MCLTCGCTPASESRGSGTVTIAGLDTSSSCSRSGVLAKNDDLADARPRVAGGRRRGRAST